MKVLNIIKKIFFGILGFVFFGFALCMTVLLLNYNKYGVTVFGNTSWILINEKIATQEFQKGDLVLVKSKEFEEIKAGDTIFTYRADDERKAQVNVGVVEKTHELERAITYKNGSSYTMEFVIGEATQRYENVGTILSVVESKWGFLFIVLVPGFLILIYEVYALIVEIKYGEEE